MRTTVDIEAPVLKELRELQKREGGTLGELVSRLLAEALAKRPGKPVTPKLDWTAKPMRALLFCLGWPTVMSYLRIATHPGIFSVPLSPAEALRNVDALVALPHVRLLSEEEGFLGVYREVTGAFPVRRNLVPDAHLAALLKQNGVRTLYTRDADFRKFAFLDVRDPFAPPR